MSSDTDANNEEEAYPHWTHKPVDELTNLEQRKWIALAVGYHRNHPTTLDRELLNGVHAYLTGAFKVNPAYVNDPTSPEFLRRNDIFAAVVGQVDEIDPADFMGETLEDDAYTMRKPHLTALIAEMRERGDQRAWTPSSGADTGGDVE